MNRSRFRQLLASGVSLVLIESVVSLHSSAKPNIVLILADDLGINDLSCYGRRDQPAPNLDRLAAQGMRFTSAFCAQPICSPSRAALLTGKTPARLHLTTYLPGRPDAPSQKVLRPQIRQELPLEETTLAESLKDAGYATACFGKWHLGGGKGFSPLEQGFDVYFPGEANTTPSAREGGKGEYALTEQAEQFIERNKTRLFFLYLPHNNPHVPLRASGARSCSMSRTMPGSGGIWRIVSHRGWRRFAVCWLTGASASVRRRMRRTPTSILCFSRSCTSKSTHPTCRGLARQRS